MVAEGACAFDEYDGIGLIEIVHLADSRDNLARRFGFEPVVRVLAFRAVGRFPKVENVDFFALAYFDQNSIAVERHGNLLHDSLSSKQEFLFTV